MDSEMLEALAPFLEEETLDDLAQKQIDKGNAAKLGKILPFMDGETVRKIIRVLMEQGDVEAVKEAAAFL